jgi:phospholipid/cholesterol/gamma-HCH transport system substrate-binding protein
VALKHISAGVKVGILTLLMLGGSYLVWKSIGKKASGSDNYVLWAKFKDASGLPEGSAVVVAGLPIGEISSLSIEGRYARINLRIRDDIKVWENAVVAKKATSLLGNYYLEIDPGGPESLDAAGKRVTHKVLASNEQIKKVVEATSPDQLMRRIEESLPNVDKVLLSVRDLSEDLRRIVNGPLKSIASRLDQLVQEEAATVSRILQRTDRTIARIEQITRDIRRVTGGADKKVNKILAEIDKASVEARKLMTSARSEVEQTGKKVRDKLDLVDDVLNSSASIAKKIDEPKGTLGKLVNDPAIADNIEEITDDAKGFLGTLFRMQTYVGLRSEFNVFARLARHYVTVELSTRPDKFYYIELEKGPRGNYPEVELVFDPQINQNAWVRRSVIRDEVRFTFQFGKRYKWASFRYGIKESTGGIGMDVNWFDDRLKMSVDLFDATFDQLPRLKIAAAYELFTHLYILAGIDEALNEPVTLEPGNGISLGNPPDDVPVQFNKFRFGRDYFLGAMLRFNDQDLATLLTVGGSAISGLVN